MKILRLAAILLLVLGALLGVAALTVHLNQDRIMHRVMEGVYERTGYRITAAATHIHLSSHLVLDFDQPGISKDGHSLAQLEKLRAVVSYHSLVYGGGMPLFSLVLVRPQFQLPAGASFAVSTPLPRIGVELVSTIIKLLNGLERAAWRIETIDAKVSNTDGTPLFDQLGILAFRRHRQSEIWRVEFGVHTMQAPFEGLRSTGKIRVGVAGQFASNQIASVSVWFWSDHAEQISFSTARLQGQVSGSAKLSLSEDGSGNGSANVSAVGLTLSSNGPGASEGLGDYAFNVKFSETADAMRVDHFDLSHQQAQLASGGAELSGLTGHKPVLRIQASAGVPVDIATVRSHLRFFRYVPQGVIDAVGQIRSGRVLLSNVSLATTPELFLNHPEVAVRESIDISAVLQGAGFALPADLKLPAVDNLNAQLRYAHNTMAATQGSATLDQSSLSDVSARFDFSKSFESLGYELSFNCDAALGQLYPAIMHALEVLKVEPRDQMKGLNGRLSIHASASGAFKLADPQPPAKYHASFEANRATLVAKGAPGPIEFARGAVIVDPGTLRFAKLALRTTGGDGLVDGTLGFDSKGVRVRDVTVELHDMPAGLWLALAVEPDSLGVVGPIGGKVRVRSDPGRPGGMLANGKLVLRTGSVQFGFLRSPMNVQGATINLDGRALSVLMPSTTLEGAALDFRMSIADMGDPTLRIDANVQRLDFEVMTFIRLPWSPSAPPAVFPIPVKGHIEVASGNLSKLQMTNIKTDFWRINGDWKVYNYTANAFNGSAELAITGRAKDDWIQIQGKVANMEIGQMFLLSGERKESPIVGRTWIGADLSADTNNDFFETLGGTVSITVRDGTLDRMKLLSRMLSMIDLKSWLTAKIPDPTVAGLPFQNIFFDLKGDHGVFNTEKFLLQGPVMTITADGQLDFSKSTMDMTLAAFPLSTFNWLLSKIPVIGENVASSAGTIVAAYFHAHGPVSDPSVTPMPITSVTEIIKKTLFLPINVIRPNTVQ